jgi:hypothetical protein
MFIVSKSPAGFDPRNHSQQCVNEEELHPVGNGVGPENLPLTKTTPIAPECLRISYSDNSYSSVVDTTQNTFT